MYSMISAVYSGLRREDDYEIRLSPIELPVSIWQVLTKLHVVSEFPPLAIAANVE